MTAERLRTDTLRSRLAGPFTLAVAAGECIAISGPSGSGKSLLLRMVADLDPNTGEVFLDERPRSGFTAPAWRRQVAYVAAESGWWGESVAEHFPDVAAARLWLPRLDLKPELIDGAVLRLSSGEKQRLALLRTLLLAPPVLLLDEPTAALDEESESRVETLFRERLAAGTAILLVTHKHEQALRLAARRFVMQAGKLRDA